jgi:hypothetical protein
MKDFNAPFYVNYRGLVAVCPNELPELKRYLTDRMPEVEVECPNKTNGIDGMVWSNQLEWCWKKVGHRSFWHNIHLKNFAYADAQLRANRPDLYEAVTSTPEIEAQMEKAQYAAVLNAYDTLRSAVEDVAGHINCINAMRAPTREDLWAVRDLLKTALSHSEEYEHK